MIAIHKRKGSFSEKWIEFCENNNINYKIVNCYDSDIIEQISDCDGLMWHWSHATEYKDHLFARQLIFSLEAKGIKVFPNSNTTWHFDDKVGQKYLLEALRLPLVQSYVFYEKETAIEWINKAEFPKVFKTRNGAGSQNVSLIKSRKQAVKLINTCFGKGIPTYNKLNTLKEAIWRYSRDKSLISVLRIIKYFLKLPLPDIFQSRFFLEKDYIYLQDFIPNNKFDIRVIVIGKRAFAIKRMVRNNDFRASGSGLILYDPEQIPLELLKSSFHFNKKLKTQSLALDFVFDIEKKQFLIVEISYGFAQKGYLSCPGYWDENLEWHSGAFNPEIFIIEDFIKNCSKELIK